MHPIEADFQAELVKIQAEAIGWIHLGDVACLYLGCDESSDNTVRVVVGLAFPFVAR